MSTEYLVQVRGTSGFVDGEHAIRSLTFVTNKHIYGPYGAEQGRRFQSTPGGKVVGFFGQSGIILNQLGVVTVLHQQLHTAHYCSTKQASQILQNCCMHVSSTESVPHAVNARKINETETKKHPTPKSQTIPSQKLNIPNQDSKYDDQKTTNQQKNPRLGSPIKKEAPPKTKTRDHQDEEQFNPEETPRKTVISARSREVQKQSESEETRRKTVISGGSSPVHEHTSHGGSVVLVDDERFARDVLQVVRGES